MSDKILVFNNPKYVGGWILPGSNEQHRVLFSMASRPNWLHRAFNRIILGWKWEDFKNV